MRILLALALLHVAGCAAPTHSALDTGDIAPGASAALRFDAEGSYAMHCHLHPFMEQTVEVIGGTPQDVHVHVLDGADVGEYRFDPPGLAIAAGSNVTYHNHGTLVHTATYSAGMPH